MDEFYCSFDTLSFPHSKVELGVYIADIAALCCSKLGTT
jgi:hypothetical protein